MFGCKAFVHIPIDERSKLDGKSKQCIFLGYGRDDFGYKFWDPVDKKIVRSRDVVFLEDQTIEDIEKEEKPKQVTHGFIDVEPKPPAIIMIRSVRERHPSQKYSPHEFVLLTDAAELECYEEAMLHEEKDKWFKSMQEKMKSLHENHTFELVNLKVKEH